MTEQESQACQLVYERKRGRPWAFLMPHQQQMFHTLCKNTDYGGYRAILEGINSPKRTEILSVEVR